MPNWLTIITSLISALVAFSKFLGDRRLIEVGRAEVITQGLQVTLANLEKAHAASNEVTNNPDGDYAVSVRKKYTRTDE